MALQGTDGYDGVGDLPPLVRRAVDAARRSGFAFSCRPEQGRLLSVLAGGVQERIGETGTGCGVGLAWLASGARQGVRLVSVERDRERARVAAGVFDGLGHVEVLHDGWEAIADHGPFDLLVLDGGGQGKDGAAADPARLLKPGGVVVIDDFTPATAWPPMFGGSPDLARLHWLEHVDLHAAELRLAADLSVIVGTRYR
ncbi:O-methyltransferase [Actinomadura fibrosa]|uniref:O-methyltransferase n=1 Tax=Actinomadura fibrosa TaxID=111802 RepID=A0ABW2Y1Y8_9ACTN|nr:class I SAM-dependent methyltransferase [Actinomadura fibrosa]